MQFIQLWKGDQATVTYVTAGIGAVLVLFGLIWVAFSRKSYEVPDFVEPGKVKSKSEWRYSKIFRGSKDGLCMVRHTVVSKQIDSAG